MELKSEKLGAASDLKAINDWIFGHHNCGSRGTIVVPSSYLDGADNGTAEIFINMSRIEGWRYRVDSVAVRPQLELNTGR